MLELEREHFHLDLLFKNHSFDQELQAKIKYHFLDM